MKDDTHIDWEDRTYLVETEPVSFCHVQLFDITCVVSNSFCNQLCKASHSLSTSPHNHKLRRHINYAELQEKNTYTRLHAPLRHEIDLLSHPLNNQCDTRSLMVTWVNEGWMTFETCNGSRYSFWILNEFETASVLCVLIIYGNS